MKKEKPFLTIDDDVQKEMGITQRSIDNLNKQMKKENEEFTFLGKRYKVVNHKAIEMEKEIKPLDREGVFMVEIKELEKEIEELLKGCGTKQEPEDDGMILAINDEGSLDFVVCGKNKRYCDDCANKIILKQSNLKLLKNVKSSFKNLLEEIKELLPDELYKKMGVQGLNRNWKQPDGEETYWELINEIINKSAIKHLGKGFLE